MDIRRVLSKQDFHRFITFPRKLYAGNPYWVPPLEQEIRFVLSDKNPFFQHAEAAYFLAWNNQTVVGRIAAILDSNHPLVLEKKIGFFGFFECIHDAAVAQALVNAAAGWLRKRDRKIMCGPMNPSTNEECGLLLEGFDSAPMVMMTYTPSYYLDLMEACGFVKSKDLYAYLSMIPEVSSGERLERLSQSVKKRLPSLVVRAADMSHFEQELESIQNIYNSAWADNWGFAPMTPDEIQCMAKRLKHLIVPDLLIMAEIDKEPVGFFMALPDYNQVLLKLNGKLGLLGLIKFLWYSRAISDIRVITMGVKKEHRRKGIEGLLYLESFKAAMRKGYQRAEMSWILEDNLLMRKGCELMGGRLYKKYRIYEKMI
ncbi:MAG: GNAT family N-acetyltransferase [Nitrospirota bacterium]